MDEGLFTKHIQSLQNREHAKHEIVLLLKKELGLILEDSSIILEKKYVTLYLSSVERSLFIKKNGKEILSQHGYFFKG